MNAGVIRFNTYEAIPAYEKLHSYQVKERLAWWQRPFVWFARKAGTIESSISINVSYTTHRLDLQRVWEGVMKHRANVQILDRRQAKYLIVGRDQLAQLEFTDYAAMHLGVHQFRLGRSVSTRPGERPYVSAELCDLEVICVPYIDGTFILGDVFNK